MALRIPLEVHFEHFWALLPKWLSGSLWRLIFTISGPLLPKWLSGRFWRFIGAQGRVCIAPVWPKTLSIAPVQFKSAHGMGPQGSSLYRTCATEVTFYRPCAAQIALRRLLEARFEHFWALLPKWLSGSLWRLILIISGPCCPNGSQKASGSSF